MPPPGKVKKPKLTKPVAPKLSGDMEERRRRILERKAALLALLNGDTEAAAAMERRKSLKHKFRKSIAAMAFMRRSHSLAATDSLVMRREEDKVNRMRVEHLSADEQQLASKAFWDFRPFQYATIYRQMVNAMASMQLARLPAEENLQQLLADVHFTEDSPKVMSYHQFLMVLDLWKGVVLGKPSTKHEESEDEEKASNRTPAKQKTGGRGNALSSSEKRDQSSSPTRGQATNSPIQEMQREASRQAVRTAVEALAAAGVELQEDHEDFTPQQTPQETSIQPIAYQPPQEQVPDGTVNAYALVKGARVFDIDILEALPRDSRVVKEHRVREQQSIDQPVSDAAAMSLIGDQTFATWTVTGGQQKQDDAPALGSTALDYDTTRGFYDEEDDVEPVAVDEVAMLLGADDHLGLLRDFITIGACDPDDVEESGPQGAMRRWEADRRRMAIDEDADPEGVKLPEEGPRLMTRYPEPPAAKGHSGGRRISIGGAQSGSHKPNQTDAAKGGAGHKSQSTFAAPPQPHYLGDAWWQALILPVPALVERTNIPPRLVFEYLKVRNHRTYAGAIHEWASNAPKPPSDPNNPGNDTFGGRRMSGTLNEVETLQDKNTLIDFEAFRDLVMMHTLDIHRANRDNSPAQDHASPPKNEGGASEVSPAVSPKQPTLMASPASPAVPPVLQGSPNAGSFGPLSIEAPPALLAGELSITSLSPQYSLAVSQQPALSIDSGGFSLASPRGPREEADALALTMSNVHAHSMRKDTLPGGNSSNLLTADLGSGHQRGSGMVSLGATQTISGAGALGLSMNTTHRDGAISMNATQGPFVSTMMEDQFMANAALSQVWYGRSHRLSTGSELLHDKLHSVRPPLRSVQMQPEMKTITMPLTFNPTPRHLRDVSTRVYEQPRTVEEKAADAMRVETATPPTQKRRKHHKGQPFVVGAVESKTGSKEPFYPYEWGKQIVSQEHQTPVSFSPSRRTSVWADRYGGNLRYSVSEDPMTPRQGSMSPIEKGSPVAHIPSPPPVSKDKKPARPGQNNASPSVSPVTHRQAPAVNGPLNVPLEHAIGAIHSTRGRGIEGVKAMPVVRKTLALSNGKQKRKKASSGPQSTDGDSNGFGGSNDSFAAFGSAGPQWSHVFNQDLYRRGSEAQSTFSAGSLTIGESLLGSPLQRRDSLGGFGSSSFSASHARSVGGGSAGSPLRRRKSRGGAANSSTSPGQTPASAPAVPSSNVMVSPEQFHSMLLSEYRAAFQIQ